MALDLKGTKKFKLLMYLWQLLLSNTENGESYFNSLMKCVNLKFIFKKIHIPCGQNVHWKNKINMIVEIHKAIGCNTVVWKVAGVISCGGFALRRRGDNIYVKLNSVDHIETKASWKEYLV